MNNFEDSSSGVGVGSIIGNKFRLEEKLGQGSFGMIFKCINLENQETFAMKMEKRNQRHSSMLVREIKVMMELKNEFGYARMITYGKDDDYNYVVMTNLGKNLDSILKKCNQRFSLATCMNIMDQMITRLEVLHNHNLIHRDIKPENFVIGPDRGFNQIYLIDFGLAKYYKDSEGNHIPMVEKKGMIGTARYASINAHQGLEQSRRDDLEALGYVLLYFIRGKLPWQQIYAETKDEKYEKIKNMKMNTPLEQLCEGCPNELVQYLRIVKKLDFTEQPNYTQLKGLFKKVITDRKLETQSQNVDWENLADYRHRKKFPITQELAQIPSQKEIALRQQQLRQQQLLQQQQQMQLQLQSKEYLPQNSAGGVGAAGVGESADNKKHPKSSTQNNIQNGQQNEKQGGVSASKNKGAKENIVTSNLPNQDVTNNNKNYHHTIQNSNNNNNQNNNVTTNNTNNKDNQQQNKSNNNNAQNQQAAAQIIDSQKQNQPQQQATNNNISISPPGGAQKTTSILNAVQSPETGKFGGESRTNAINDSGLALQNNERISKNGGSTLVNILGQSGQNNTNSNNPNNQNNQLNNREVSVSILNNHPNFQLNSSQNNSINGIQQTNNSPVNNPNSSSLIGNGIMEKRNSFLHALNQIHGNSNHNLLNVPTKDQVSVSYTSIAGTSKLNNYSGSDSDTIVDEGGINISTMMMINRNASPMSTSDIRRDIRTRSLVIRQSQLEIGELDLNRIQDHNSNHFKHTNNSVNHAQTNGVYKSDFNHGGIDSHRQNHHDSTHNIDNTSSPKKTNKSGKQNSHTNNNQQENIINGKMSASAVNGKANSSSQNNGYAAYRQYASAEEIKEHQDEENNSNTRNIKNYKTQFTPITEVKESTYKSLKTKTSKASFFGENITESMYEHPIMINIMPIKKAFLKKN